MVISSALLRTAPGGIVMEAHDLPEKYEGKCKSWIVAEKKYLHTYINFFLQFILIETLIAIFGHFTVL